MGQAPKEASDLFIDGNQTTAFLRNAAFAHGVGEEVAIGAERNLAVARPGHVHRDERRPKSFSTGHKFGHLPVDDAGDVELGIDKQVVALGIDMLQEELFRGVFFGY